MQSIRKLRFIVAEKNVMKMCDGRYNGMTDRRMDKGKTVHPPPSERGYKNQMRLKKTELCFAFVSFLLFIEIVVWNFEM